MAVELTVAIGGLGAIGAHLARALDAGVEGLRLVAVAARDQAKARRTIAGFRSRAEAGRAGRLAERRHRGGSRARRGVRADAEARSPGPHLRASSVGALLPRMHLVARARETGARIVVPTGALLGLDAVRAAAEGKVEQRDHRDPQAAARPGGRALSGRARHRRCGITAPKRRVRGQCLRAAEGFPANVNVAAALALAGIGPERTMVEIWGDPTVTRNTHTIRRGGRDGAADHDDRERASRGESAHRQDHAAVDPRLPARADAAR